MRTSLGKILLWLFCATPLLYGYSIAMHADNTHPLLAEPITLTIDFEYDNLEEYEIEEPHFAHFKIAPLEEKESQEENGTWHVRQRYRLIPQKTGILTLSPLKVHIEMIPPAYQKRYNKNRYLQKFDLLTKPLSIEVEPLPQGLQIAGDYRLTSSIDTQQTTSGTPIHFTLTLLGNGNLENLDFFSLKIPHATVYEQRSNAHTKTFAIVSQRAYVIPPVVLKYYNLKTKTVTLTGTQAYPVHISKKLSTTELYIAIASLLLVLVLTLYAWRMLSILDYLDEKAHFIRQLKQCQNKEALLKKVAPYIQESRTLSRLIYRLEESNTEGFKGIKREIMRYFYH